VRFGDAAAPDARTIFEDFKTRAGASGVATDIEGIGEGAVLTSAGMATHHDGTYVEITRLRLTDEQLIEIARLAIANL
jgi:hypothetical protein